MELLEGLWQQVLGISDSEIWASLWSDLAKKIYFWSAVSASFLGSLVMARLQLNVLNTFNEKSPIKLIPGPKPTLLATIQKQIQIITEAARDVWKAMFLRSATLVLFGMIVPIVLLSVIAANHEWLFPGNSPLSECSPPEDPEQYKPPARLCTPISGEIAPIQFASFIVDQSLKGALNDVVEGFGEDIGSVINNPSNLPFTILVIVFRFFTGTTAIALGYLTWRYTMSRRALNSHLRPLEKRLKIALARAPN